MASLALCPRCSHDLLVPSGTDPDAWAQCPACSVLFQVKDATQRELAELHLVGAVAEPTAESNYNYLEAPLEPARDELFVPRTSPTVALGSEKTLPDVLPPTDYGISPLPGDFVDEVLQPLQPAPRSSPTIDDAAPSSAPTWDEIASQGDTTPTAAMEPSADEDFASARTISNIPEPSVPASAQAGATIDGIGELPSEADADFELEDDIELPSDIAVWDDSEHIDRLLAGRDDQLANDELPSHAPANAADDVDTAETDQPIINANLFTTPSASRRRRRPSLVRMLIGIVISGLIGTGLGILSLLWILGPSGDIFEVARYLPPAILPSSFSTPGTQVADATTSQRVDSDAEQASFNAPTTSGDSILDDVAASQNQEPAPLEVPDASPVAATARPANAPSFSPEQLAAALTTAKQAQPGLVSGSLHDSSAVMRAKGYSYSILSDLADKTTFVVANSAADNVADLRRQADELFRDTLSQPHTRNDVAQIVPKWIGSKSRKNAGVFFAGTVIGEMGAGPIVECRLDPGSGAPLTVLIPESMASDLPSAGQPIGIVGAIVDSPALNVSGYRGDAAQAIWTGRIIPLE